MLDLIVKNSAPIINNRIKEVIIKVARDHNLPDIHKVEALLKITDYQAGKMEVFTFYRSADNVSAKQISRIPMNEITGSITRTVEGYMFSIFIRDAKIYQTNTAMVNYLFKIYPDNNLYVHPYINGIIQERMTLKEIL